MIQNRRDIRLHKGVVSGALPEHFTTQYPRLVAFLEAYYEILREDNEQGFDRIISNLVESHDLLEVDLGVLEYALKDLSKGVDYSTALSDARLKAQMFASWYRTKGSLFSIEIFFRWLLGQDAVVEYGKEKVFIVSESRLGPTSLRFIKNDKLYQTFALLIKVGSPVSRWRDAYKSLVHPAGFYFQGEVVIESFVDVGTRFMDIVVLDDNAGTVVVENGTATIGISTFTSITGLYPDDGDADGDQQRVEFRTYPQDIGSLTITQLDETYRTINDLIDPNSPTFDSIDDGSFKSVKFSSTVETMDQDLFDLVTVGDDFKPLLADSDISETRMDNIIFTFDNSRITLDRTV